MKLGGIHHIALWVKDLSKCTAFYHDVLGLHIVRHWDDPQGQPRSVWLDLTGGVLLMLEKSTLPSVDKRKGWHMVSLSINAQERTHVESILAQHGVSIVGRTEYSLYIQDPEGNHVGLSHWPDPASDI
jgi:glyoxylase I family protein